MDNIIIVPKKFKNFLKKYKFIPKYSKSIPKRFCIDFMKKKFFILGNIFEFLGEKIVGEIFVFFGVKFNF